MNKINIAVFGGSGRCIALAARELKQNVSVSVFFDNDKNKAGHLVKKGYQYVDGSKVYIPYDIYIDNPEHFQKYNFEYIVIFAGRRREIKQQLLDLGIEPKKIIVYDRIISNGIIEIPLMRESLPLEKLLLCAEGGISPAMYKKEAKNLFYICSSIFQRNYRIYVLEILVTALEAAIEHHIIKYRGIKLDYQSFAVNPSLFMCESADIFMDIIEEPLERIEFGEGPYDFAGITVEENDVVFDIGANFGLFSAVAASKARKGKVYAFEPVKETRKILKHTADLYDNIIIEPYAISNICGKSKIDLSTYDFNQGEASVMTVNGSSTKTDEVKTITLDQFVKTNHISRIDFIKADIEGAERLLLSGAKEVLQKFAPKLSLCTYHYPEDTALLEFIIKQANPNYVIEKAYHKLYAYVNK